MKGLNADVARMALLRSIRMKIIHERASVHEIVLKLTSVPFSIGSQENMHAVSSIKTGVLCR